MNQPLALPDLTHFRARVIQDALAESTAEYWLRRAEQLAAARPVPGEHQGQADDSSRSRRWRDLTAAAEACRARAVISAAEADIEPEVWTALGHAIRGHDEALFEVEARLTATYALEAATRRLRLALNAGDPDAIASASYDVDQVDPALMRIRVEPFIEPVDAMFRRHQRVLAALDDHRATLGAAA